MAFQFFVVPLRSTEAEVEDLNRFLRGHRVLTIDRRWVEAGAESFWSFCIEYLETNQGSSSPFQSSGATSKGTIDYRAILSPEDFAVFARLRNLRSGLAKVEAVPPYTIFTNAQLAEMAKNRPATKAEMGRIAGVGESRIERYAEQFLAMVDENRGKADEAIRPVDGTDPGAG